jgi:hypothetical protein
LGDLLANAEAKTDSRNVLAFGVLQLPEKLGLVFFLDSNACVFHTYSEQVAFVVKANLSFDMPFESEF